MKSFPFYTIVLLALMVSCSKEEEKPVDIVVTFSQVSAEAQLTSVTLNATVARNRGTVEEAGFIFGENPGLTMTSGEKLEANSKFNVVIEKTDLQAGKLYYARPYAIVEGDEFLGDEISFTTTEPTYSSVSPLTAGRGQRVVIAGDFKTDDVEQVILEINGTETSILTYNNVSLTFLVPETATIGSAVDISLTIVGHDLEVSEKITISRWSILANIPSPNSFVGSIADDITYNFLYNNEAYHFSSSRAYVYNQLTDSWTQNDAIGNAAVLPDPVYFQIGSKGYAGLFAGGVTLRQFDFTTKAWSTVGDFPGETRNFYYGVFGVRGDKAYYGLGYHEDGGGIMTGKKDFWEFNSANGQWTQRNNFPGDAIGYGISFTINEYVFVGVGRNRESDSWLRKMYAFHTADNTWTQVADYPGPQTTFMKAFALGKKGFVLANEEIWVYDFDSNTWSLYPDRIPGSAVRNNPQVFVGSDFFLVGSGIGDAYRSDFYKLYPY